MQRWRADDHLHSHRVNTSFCHARASSASRNTSSDTDSKLDKTMLRYRQFAHGIAGKYHAREDMIAYP